MRKNDTIINNIKNSICEINKTTNDLDNLAGSLLEELHLLSPSDTAKIQKCLDQLSALESRISKKFKDR